MQLRPFAAWSELQRSLLLFFSVSWQALLCSERKRVRPVMVDRWLVPALDLRLLLEHITPQRRVHHFIAWVSQLICLLPFQLSLYLFSGQFALGSHSAFNTICMIGHDIPHSWPYIAPFFCSLVLVVYLLSSATRLTQTITDARPFRQHLLQIFCFSCISRPQTRSESETLSSIYLVSDVHLDDILGRKLTRASASCFSCHCSPRP